MGVAVAGALLAVTVCRLHRVIDIDETDAAGVAEQRGMAGQVHQQLGGYLVELTDMTESERPQERAQRRWCPDPPNSRLIPPCRSRSKSSIESAPATIPATTAAALTAAFGFGTVNTALPVSCSPHRPANASTGTNPADDTRFGSSNATDMAETV
jgi:hypothetical protein